MTTIHTKWRLQLAEQLAERIRTFNGVRAIVVAGSVARGYADEYSDVELPVFWDTLPDDETRHAIVAALGADFLHAYDGPSQEDQLLINNFQVDLWHNTLAEEEVVIENVLERYSTDLGESNFVDTLRFCIPLYGEEIIRKWKRQAQEYPAELALRNINSNLSVLDLSQLAVLAYRDNPSMYYSEISQLQQGIFLILLALNRAYFPTFKWMYHALDTMRVKPDRVTQRFRRMYDLPYEEGTVEMRQIVAETFDLVEQSFPLVDTTDARQRAAYVRVSHSQPVKFGDKLDRQRV